METYNVVGFLILTVLMISYCQAYARAHITVRFAHEVMKKIEPKSEREQARRFFDNLVGSTVTRVSGLAELAGAHRFAALYYSILKVVAIAVIFGIPIFALIASLIQLTDTPGVASWIYILSLITFGVTAFAVLLTLYTEMREAGRNAKRYWKGQLLRQSSLPQH